MKKPLIFVVVLVVAYFGWHQLAEFNVPEEGGRGKDSAPALDYGDGRSGQQVEGARQVIRILSDDNDGSRHQRFIVRLEAGRTFLMAHNIDIAPRVSSLKTGDTVSFFGEYEWNDKGGVIHWTHKDPQRRHVAGWIRHNGRLYH